jgi:hypothetical protein
MTEIPQILQSVKIGLKVINTHLMERVKEAFRIFRRETIGFGHTSTFPIIPSIQMESIIKEENKEDTERHKFDDTFLVKGGNILSDSDSISEPYTNRTNLTSN